MSVIRLVVSVAGRALVAALLLASQPGCLAEVPPCQLAVSNFYRANCFFIDLRDGHTVEPQDAAGVCLSIEADAAPACVPTVEAWKVCLNNVPSPAREESDCDCMPEQRAMLDCR